MLTRRCPLLRKCHTARYSCMVILLFQVCPGPEVNRHRLGITFSKGWLSIKPFNMAVEACTVGWSRACAVFVAGHDAVAAGRQLWIVGQGKECALLYGVDNAVVKMGLGFDSEIFGTIKRLSANGLRPIKCRANTFFTSRS